MNPSCGLLSKSSCREQTTCFSTSFCFLSRNQKYPSWTKFTPVEWFRRNTITEERRIGCPNQRWSWPLMGLLSHAIRYYELELDISLALLNVTVDWVSRSDSHPRLVRHSMRDSWPALHRPIPYDRNDARVLKIWANLNSVSSLFQFFVSLCINRCSNLILVENAKADHRWSVMLFQYGSALAKNKLILWKVAVAFLKSISLAQIARVLVSCGRGKKRAEIILGFVTTENPRGSKRQWRLSRTPRNGSS